MDYAKYINRPGYQLPAGYDQSKYPGHSTTTDVAVFSFFDSSLHTLLIKRKNMPFKGYWALPGGFVEKDEDLIDSARRELFEETGLKRLKLYEFGVFGHPKRDPRGRTITAAYLALVRKENVKPVAGDDAGEVKWFPAIKPPELAFDHDLELKAGVERLRELAILTPALFDLLPVVFKEQDFFTIWTVVFKKLKQPHVSIEDLLKNKIIKKVPGKGFKLVRKNFAPGWGHCPGGRCPLLKDTPGFGL
jgi:8-oxo-dGTP diphosphatase